MESWPKYSSNKPFLLKKKIYINSRRDKKQILIRSRGTRRGDWFEYSVRFENSWHAKNLHRSRASPSFHDRFHKLKWIRYFSTRRTFHPPPSLPQSFSIHLHSSLGSIGFESFDPAYRSNNRVTKFRYGADSNYLSDWNIQNADNPPPVVSRRFNEPWILDVDDLEGEGGRFDRILNEGSRDLFLHSGVKKDNWPSCLRGEGYGRTSWRGFEKFIVNNGGYIYIYLGFDSSILG